MQPDAITETLQRIALEIAGVAPPTELDDQGRPLWLFEQTAHETCDRAGYAEQGRFAETLADHGTCLAKLGCAGPVAKCNVPARGWVNGVGGCPNVGGICIACTMPGFPDHFLPFMDSGAVHAPEHVRQPLPLRPRAAPFPRAQHAQAVAVGRLTR